MHKRISTMLAKYAVLTLTFVLMFTFFNFGSTTKVAYAALWKKPVISTEDNTIKVTVSNKSLTKGPITITINSADYKNGHNVIYSLEHNKQIASSIAKFQITKNGFYQFAISDVNSDFDYDKSDSILRGEKWCSVEITNIDNKKPTIKYVGSFIDYMGYKNIRIDTDDDMGIHKIIQPNGEYSIYDEGNTLGVGAMINYPVTKNGNYKFIAEDFAGNKKELVVTVKDYKKTPISVNKVTNKTQYIFGKTLPNAKIIVGNSKENFGITKANSKGTYKIKLKSKLKTSSTFYVWAFDSKNKYAMNSVKIKVSSFK